jgi:hypothetical protein
VNNNDPANIRLKRLQRFAVPGHARFLAVSSSKVGVIREDGHLARLKKRKMWEVGRLKKAVNPNGTQ